MAESVVGARMRAVSSERVAKRNGEGRKEKKIGWWVPCMEKKEREKTVSGYEKKYPLVE